METFNVIDKLNDDCLISIFEFLPILHLIRIEIVCRRWQCVIRSMSNKRIIISTDLEFCHLREILKKFGTGNIILNIEGKNKPPNGFLLTPSTYLDLEHVFKIINECCKKSIKLSVSRFTIKNVFLLDDQRFPFLKNLLSLSMDDINFAPMDEKSINALMEFWGNKNYLTKFNIRLLGGMKINNVERKLSIGPTLMDMNLNFEHLFARCTKVKKLRIIGYTRSGQVYTFFLRDLNPISNQLISLKITCCPSDFLGDGCKAMSFPNLRSFSLIDSRFLVEDNFIFNIVKQCPMLEKFGIFDCKSNLSSTTYRCLGDLKNLMVLQIRFSVAEPINNKDFEYIAAKCTKLKYIYFDWPALNLYPSELINIVNLLPNLTILDIGAVEHMTKECFRSVLESVKRRTNGKQLAIQYRGVKAEQIERLGLKRRVYDEKRGLWLAPKPYYVLMISVYDDMKYYVDDD